MDRFIDADGETEYYIASYLKSNMDRFIEKSNKCENQQKSI